MEGDGLADHEWFASLYQASYRRLVLTVYALTNDLGAAEEIIQEAYALAYGQRARVAAADNPEAWIRTVAVNLARRRARRRVALDRILRRHPEAQEPDEPTSLHHAIRALNEEHRTVVVLHYLADLPVEEIASLVDIPIGTVKSRLAGAGAALGTARELDLPDLDDELGELRVTLRETVRQRELDRVIERSRQRGVRRRTQLSAIAAVLVVGAAIPLLRTVLRPVADDPVPLLDTGSPTAGGTVSPYTPSQYVYDLDFADTRHGFALRANCLNPQATDCELELMATEDGERWQPRALPKEVTRSTAGLIQRMSVLGPRSIVVGEFSLPGSKRFHSTDAGQTWTPVPTGDTPSTATIPDGAILDSGCTSFLPDGDCHSALSVIEPRTGRTLTLQNPPPVTDPVVARGPMIAGGWWVAGTDPATGRWTLAVTRDAARSWSTAGLPSWTGRTWAISLSAHGTTLYAAVSGELPSEPGDVENGLVALFRSEDGGRSWEQTFSGHDGNEPRSIGGSPVATADGRLIVATESGSVWGSSDGGRHFTLLPNPDFTGWVARTRAGYLASTSIDQSTVYKVSTDGVAWREIAVR